jgi:hypothetical protein
MAICMLIVTVVTVSCFLSCGDGFGLDCNFTELALVLKFRWFLEGEGISQSVFSSVDSSANLFRVQIAYLFGAAFRKCLPTPGTQGLIECTESHFGSNFVV